MTTNDRKVRIEQLIQEAKAARDRADAARETIQRQRELRDLRRAHQFRGLCAGLGLAAACRVVEQVLRARP